MRQHPQHSQPSYQQAGQTRAQAISAQQRGQTIPPQAPDASAFVTGALKVYGTGAAVSDVLYYFTQTGDMAAAGAATSHYPTAPEWEHSFEPYGADSAAWWNFMGGFSDFMSSVETGVGMTDVSRRYTDQAFDAASITKDWTSATRWFAKMANDCKVSSTALEVAAYAGPAAAGIGVATSGATLARQTYAIGGFVKKEKEHRQIRDDAQSRADATHGIMIEALEKYAAVSAARMERNLRGDASALAEETLTEFVQSKLAYSTLVAKTEAAELVALTDWSKRNLRWQERRHAVDMGVTAIKLAAGIATLTLGIIALATAPATVGAGPAVLLGFGAALALGVMVYKTGRHFLHQHRQRDEFKSIMTAFTDSVTSKESIAEALGMPMSAVSSLDSAVGGNILAHMENLHQFHVALSYSMKPWSNASNSTPQADMYYRAALAHKLLRLESMVQSFHPSDDPIEIGRQLELEAVYKTTLSLGLMHGMVVVGSDGELCIKRDRDETITAPNPESDDFYLAVLNLCRKDPLFKHKTRDDVWALFQGLKGFLQHPHLERRFIPDHWHKGRAAYHSKKEQENLQKARSYRQKGKTDKAEKAEEKAHKEALKAADRAARAKGEVTPQSAAAHGMHQRHAAGQSGARSVLGGMKDHFRSGSRAAPAPTPTAPYPYPAR